MASLWANNGSSCLVAVNYCPRFKESRAPQYTRCGIGLPRRKKCRANFRIVIPFTARLPTDSSWPASTRHLPRPCRGSQGHNFVFVAIVWQQVGNISRPSPCNDGPGARDTPSRDFGPFPPPEKPANQISTKTSFSREEFLAGFWRGTTSARRLYSSVEKGSIGSSRVKKKLSFHILSHSLQKEFISFLLTFRN